MRENDGTSDERAAGTACSARQDVERSDTEPQTVQAAAVGWQEWWLDVVAAIQDETDMTSSDVVHELANYADELREMHATGVDARQAADLFVSEF